MTDNELLARIDERMKTIFLKVENIEGHLEKLPCSEQQLKTENLDGRLRPIENIFWKIVISSSVISAIGGSVAGVIAGG